MIPRCKGGGPESNAVSQDAVIEERARHQRILVVNASAQESRKTDTPPHISQLTRGNVVG